jgi:exodeoxyribonuclease VIII
MAPEPGIYRDVSFDEYRSWRAWNATSIKAFTLSSPFHGFAAFNGTSATEEKTCFIKGSAIHCATLTPEQFDAQYAIGPAVRRNSKEWKAFEDANPGKQCLKPDECADVMGMRNALMAEPLAAALIKSADWREVSVVWTDEQTGLLCKMRLDMYSSKQGVLLDLKSTTDSDTEKFERPAHVFGYALQLAFYARGLAAHKLPTNGVGIIAVESSAPYGVNVLQPDSEWFLAGEADLQAALPAIKECTSNGVWPGYVRNRKPNILRMPAWAAKKRSQES